MNKKIASVLCMVSLGMTVAVGAEPISFEQASNVTGLAGIEVGANYDYAYTSFQKTGFSEVKQTMSDIPVFVRVGLPILEAKVTIPYGTAKNTVDDKINNPEDKNYSGMGDVGLMVKTGLSLPVVSLGAGLDMTFPTGDPKKLLGEGLNAMPFVAAGIDAMVLKINANVGFKYRGEYSVEGARFDAATNQVVVDQGIKLNPGDATHYAVGLEIPAGDVLSLHAELVGENYGAATYDGTLLDNSGGRTMSLVPGIRLHAGPLKAKFAYSIPLEKKEDRPVYAPTADWRILAGLSLQFSL
jgi:hypothetical protein